MIFGICQNDVRFEDREFNLLKARDQIDECKKGGAKAVFFPEMSMTGFTMNVEKVWEDENGPVNTAMSELAVEFDIFIGYGYVRRDEKGFYNTYVILDNRGKVISSYDKIHPFSMSDEDKFYQKGDSLSFCYIGDIKIATVICYDLRFGDLFSAAAKNGADAVVVAANFGGERDNHWKTLVAARAIENQFYTIGANRVGTDPETFYFGHSMAVAPDGRILGMLDDIEGCLLFEIDKKEVTDWRKKFPALKDRRPEIYKNL